jgi:hypothetical protein
MLDLDEAHATTCGRERERENFPKHFLMVMTMMMMMMIMKEEREGGGKFLSEIPFVFLLCVYTTLKRATEGERERDEKSSVRQIREQTATIMSCVGDENWQK